MAQHSPAIVDRATCDKASTAPMLPSSRQAPLIEIHIGTRSLRMLLDTGGQGGRIADSVAKSLGLPIVGEAIAGDPSGKHGQAVKIYKVPEIVIGDVHLYGVRMIGSGGRDGGKLSDGVLGTAAFGDLLLTLDYPKKLVEIEIGSLPKESIKYSLRGGVPLLSVELGKVKFDAHVDSGSDGGLMVPMKYKDQLPLAEAPHVVGHARTLFNEFDIYGAKLKEKPKIEGMPLDVLEVEIQDLFPIGNIGGKVLKMYAVTLDQKNRRIRFKKES